MGDEMTVQVGDVVTSVTNASEEGWLEGELRGKRGIFPSNFVKVRYVHQEFAFMPSVPGLGLIPSQFSQRRKSDEMIFCQGTEIPLFQFTSFLD